MKEGLTVVIGAGPYGMSVAAHLRRYGLLQVILGRPMEFWQAMPEGMVLKSPWSASSLADPSRASTIDQFVRHGGGERVEPIPLPMFIDYGLWFQRRQLGEVDETMVRQVSPRPNGFVVELADGRSLHPRRVVVATGIKTFPYVPEYARELSPDVCSHTVALRQPSRFAGADVVVVGAGQSALESAALLSEAGAAVEVISRGPVRWANRRLHETTGPARRLFYPPSDVGPVGLNWVVAFPLLVRRLPPRVRLRLRDRAVRPSGAKWLRQRVETGVTVTASTAILSARHSADRLVLTLSDGTTRTVDHIVLGTGYRPKVADLDFLAPRLGERVTVDARGYPVLDAWLQSSVPGLHFVGALASGAFGPLCGFVAGTAVTARRVAERCRRAA